VPATPPHIPTKSKKMDAERADALEKKKAAKKATSTFYVHVFTFPPLLLCAST
jgi:hypothetical protein